MPDVQVKNHLWLFVNCLIENPTFDSQTKENMTLQQKSFGSTCSLSDKFIKQVRRTAPVKHMGHAQCFYLGRDHILLDGKGTIKNNK